MGKRLLELLGLVAGFSFISVMMLSPRYYQGVGFNKPDVTMRYTEHHTPYYLGWDLDKDSSIDKARVYGFIGGQREVYKKANEFKDIERSYSESQ